MKISELVGLLSPYDPETEIVLARDEEGNGFHYLADVTSEDYYDGEIREPDEEGYDESELVVVLWP